MSLASRYAAVLSSLDPKQVVLYMKARGHLSLLPQVVRILERAPEKDTAVVSVAKKEDGTKLKHDIGASLAELGVKGAHRTVVDSRMVGGYTARANGKVLDKSFRSALVRIYQNVVNS